MRVLSIDPGKTNGWAEWVDGTLIGYGQLGVTGMLDVLDWEWDALVAEGYRLDHRAGRQKGSELEAVQVIGAAKMRAAQLGVVLYLQRTESRDMGYVHAGLKKAGSHADSHALDAVAHGFWWHESQGVVPDIRLLR